MSRNLSEGSPAKDAAATEFGVRQLFRRPAPEPIVAVYHIKVVGDLQVVATGDGKFIWAIEEDIAGMQLAGVEADVTTISSSGGLLIQLRNIDNGNVDMLSTRVGIDVSETHSRTAATPPVINLANADVAHGDRLSIDVDSAGTGAMGLGFVAKFSVAI